MRKNVFTSCLDWSISYIKKYTCVSAKYTPTQVYNIITRLREQPENTKEVTHMSNPNLEQMRVIVHGMMDYHDRHSTDTS